MAYTHTWNAAFEALPADSENISQGADRIRDLKNAIRERMESDHYWDEAGTDADHGEHLTITLREQASVSSPGTGKAYLYAKTVSGKPELVYKDEDDNEIQLTSAGASPAVSIPSGTTMLFYEDTAPTGWTIDDTLDDKLVFVTKGSAAGGETGGGAHASGTWTQPNHTHAYGTLSGTGTLTDPSGPGAWAVSGSLYGNTSTSVPVAVTGSTANGATAASWRPAAYCFIICSKD